jgi:hypothetical protein
MNYAKRTTETPVNLLCGSPRPDASAASPPGDPEGCARAGSGATAGTGGGAARSRRRHALVPAAFGALSLSLLLGLSACGDDDNETETPTSEGRVRVHLTDAPFPYAMVDSAVVRIDSLSLHLDAGAEFSGWLTIDEMDREVNLLALQNGTTEIVADAVVPEGEVDQLRLHVSEAHVTLVDGRTFELDVPSADLTGIKVFPSPSVMVSSAGTTELLLDFDVSNSFRPVPPAPSEVDDIQQFDFEPTLSVANLTSTGSISGTVFTSLGTEVEIDDLPLSFASVTVYDGPTEVASTATTLTGEFHLRGLAPGTYTVKATALGFLESSLSATVEERDETDGLEFRLDPSDG